MSTKTAKTLSFETIQHVRGGAIAVAVNQALQACRHDCRDRPALDKDREVVLRIKVRPKQSEDSNEFEDALVAFDISRKLPSKSLVVNMIDGENGLEFQPMASDNPRQGTLIGAEDDEG